MFCALRLLWLVMLGLCADHVSSYSSVYRCLYHHPMSCSEHQLSDILDHLFSEPDKRDAYLSSVSDRKQADAMGASLLYGEMLPAGVTRALDARHLDAAKATRLYDLGMGIGRLAIQAFLQYPSLAVVVGVEISSARKMIAFLALQQLSLDNPTLFDFLLSPDKSTARLTFLNDTTTSGFDRGSGTPQHRGRGGMYLEFRLQNLVHTTDAATADIIILETELPTSILPAVCDFVATWKEGVRVISYDDLPSVCLSLFYKTAFSPLLPLSLPPLPRTDAGNGDVEEMKMPTSWNPDGHLFFFYRKVSPTNHQMGEKATPPLVASTSSSLSSRTDATTAAVESDSPTTVNHNSHSRGEESSKGRKLSSTDDFDSSSSSSASSSSSMVKEAVEHVLSTLHALSLALPTHLDSDANLNDDEFDDLSLLSPDDKVALRNLVHHIHLLPHSLVDRINRHALPTSSFPSSFPSFSSSTTTTTTSSSSRTLFPRSHMSRIKHKPAFPLQPANELELPPEEKGGGKGGGEGGAEAAVLVEQRGSIGVRQRQRQRVEVEIMPPEITATLAAHWAPGGAGYKSVEAAVKWCWSEAGPGTTKVRALHKNAWSKMVEDVKPDKTAKNVATERLHQLVTDAAIYSNHILHAMLTNLNRRRVAGPFVKLPHRVTGKLPPAFPKDFQEVIEDAKGYQEKAGKLEDFYAKLEGFGKAADKSKLEPFMKMLAYIGGLESSSTDTNIAPLQLTRYAEGRRLLASSWHNTTSFLRELERRAVQRSQGQPEQQQLHHHQQQQPSPQRKNKSNNEAQGHPGMEHLIVNNVRARVTHLMDQFAIVWNRFPEQVHLLLAATKLDLRPNRAAAAAPAKRGGGRGGEERETKEEDALPSTTTAFLLHFEQLRMTLSDFLEAYTVHHAMLSRMRYNVTLV